MYPACQSAVLPPARCDQFPDVIVLMAWQTRLPVPIAHQWERSPRLASSSAGVGASLAPIAARAPAFGPYRTARSAEPIPPKGAKLFDGTDGCRRKTRAARRARDRRNQSRPCARDCQRQFSRGPAVAKEWPRPVLCRDSDRTRHDVHFRSVKRHLICRSESCGKGTDGEGWRASGP